MERDPVLVEVSAASCRQRFNGCDPRYAMPRENDDVKHAAKQRAASMPTRPVAVELAG